MARRTLVALFCCTLLFAGAEPYSSAAALSDANQGGSGNSDGGRGNSDGGRGNSDGGRGNSDGGRGNSDGGRGNSDGGRGNSDGGRGNSDGGRGNSDGGRGNSDGGRGNSDGGRGAADSGGRAGADGGARGGNSQGAARGRTGNDAFGSKGWGTTSPERAREAVSHGWALPLSKVLPTVSTAVPGQVLEVDLRQTWTGEWHYDFLVLTRDRRYREVVVNARSNEVLQVRRR